MTGQSNYDFRRSCETADMLQLSTARYLGWIVNSIVCSVLACAWVCVATLSFLVWNRCLLYRWFQCFHLIHLIACIHLDMLIANGIRVFLVLFDPVTENPFRFSDVFCTTFFALDLTHDTVICPRCSWH